MRYFDSDKGSLKRALELDYMPNEVDRKLNDIYSELPEKLPVATEKRTGIRFAISTMGTLAAAIAALFILNIMNPAYAEELPLVGGLFRAINGTTDMAKSINVERVEEHISPLAEEATGESELFKMSVSDVYFDGVFLHAVARLETEENLDEITNPDGMAVDTFQYIMGVYIGGSETEAYIMSNANSVSRFVKAEDIGREAEENTYYKDISFGIPLDARTYDDTVFKLAFDFQAIYETDKVYELSRHESIEKVEVEFTAEYDPSEAIIITGPVESNGITLTSFYSSPSVTEVVYEQNVDPPADLNMGELRDGDGNRLQFLQDNPNEKQVVTVFQALDKEDRTAEFFLPKYANGEMSKLASFIIDLENKTITAND